MLFMSLDIVPRLTLNEDNCDEFMINVFGNLNLRRNDS